VRKLNEMTEQERIVRISYSLEEARQKIRQTEKELNLLLDEINHRPLKLESKKS